MPPITNTRPYKSITLTGAFAYITGHYAAEQTRTLHSITDKNQTRLYKAAHFDYGTFCGQFRTRSDKDVLEVSNLICLDFDHLVNVECLFQKLLLRDGTAVPKPIRPRPQMGHPHRRESPVPRRLLRRAAYYIKQTYSIEVDKSGKDLSRACFLPHDSNAYLNPKYATR